MMAKKEMKKDKKCCCRENMENGMENIEEGNTCCTHRTKERSEKEYQDLIKRLNRIEGQIRGVKGMVEKDAYCIDILTQVSAVTAALNSFRQVLLENHLKTCVTNDILAGDPQKNQETMEELMVVIKRMMK